MTLSLLDLTDFESAQANAAYWLEKLAEKAAKDLTKIYGEP